MEFGALCVIYGGIYYSKIAHRNKNDFVDDLFLF